jgi:hypothetical protein
MGSEAQSELHREGAFGGPAQQHQIVPRNGILNDAAIASVRHAALVIWFVAGAPYGVRTRVTHVRGECPRPLDERGSHGQGIGRGVSRGKSVRPAAFDLLLDDRQMAILCGDNRGKVRQAARSFLLAWGGSCGGKLPSIFWFIPPKSDARS